MEIVGGAEALGDGNDTETNQHDHNETEITV